MLKTAILFASLAAAGPALAQEQGGGTPPAIQTAAQAFGQCISKGVTEVAANVTPEAGARTLLASCATQRTALESAVENFIATSNMPEAEKTAARAQMRAEMARAESEVARMIQQRRSAPAK